VKYLVMFLLALSQLAVRAENCPPEAVTTGGYLSIVALRRDGTAIRTGTVGCGDVISVISAIVFLPVSAMDGSPNAAFSGGVMKIAGVDVTTPGGVPILGYEACGGINMARSTPYRRAVTHADATAGNIFVTATYSNMWMRASSTVRVRVRPPMTPTAYGLRLRTLKAHNLGSLCRTAARARTRSVGHPLTTLLLKPKNA
jgi:hypothetical protein